MCRFTDAEVLNFPAAGVTEEAQAATPALLSSVVDLCNRSRNDWYRVYLIRKLCSQQGAEFVQKLLKVPDFRWLFPDEILKQVGMAMCGT